jgi:hypothetical protein
LNRGGEGQPKRLRFARPEVSNVKGKVRRLGDEIAKRFVLQVRPREIGLEEPVVEVPIVEAFWHVDTNGRNLKYAPATSPMA